MELHKLIFRVDYPSAFALFNNWGSVYELLDSNSFWGDLGENTVTRTINARRGNEFGREMHLLNVEVTDTNGVFEAHPIQSIRDYEGAFRNVTEIIRMLKVKEFNRIGVRFFFLEPVDEFKTALESVAQRVNADYWRTLGGAPADISLISIHRKEDQSLKLTVGPISKKEYRHWFSLPNRISLENALLLDMDCFAFHYKLEAFELLKVVEFYYSQALQQASRIVECLKGKD